MTMRIGFGYDVHAFTPGRPLVLGGVSIPFEYGQVDGVQGTATIHPSAILRADDERREVEYQDFVDDLRAVAERLAA